MIREQYFKELAIVLQKEGFTPLSEQEQRLPVAWKGRHLCWITETGGVRYVPQDVNTIEAEHACAKAIDLAAAVQEYAAAMESAPVLEAKGLESGFCLLLEFNNVVLAGHQTEHGTQFITWVWDNNHTSLNFGGYYMLDYKGAKEAFALRSGLVSRGQFFDQEQMTEIYRAVHGFLSEQGPDFIRQEEKCRQLLAQIKSQIPDLEQRLKEMEGHTFEQSM